MLLVQLQEIASQSRDRGVAYYHGVMFQFQMILHSEIELVILLGKKHFQANLFSQRHVQILLYSKNIDKVF